MNDWTGTTKARRMRPRKDPNEVGLGEAIAADLRKHGYDLTPEQALRESEKALDKIRVAMMKKGYFLPTDDADLIASIRAAREQDWDDLPEEPLTDEEVERLLEKIPKLPRKPWFVSCPLEGVIQRFERRSEAVASAVDRNARARLMGLSVRYHVKMDDPDER